METKKLSSLCLKIGSGATPTGGKESYLPSGDICLIRSQNVLDLSFSYDGLAYITPEQARLLDGVAIQRDDVLLNITGDSVARVCSVPPAIKNARVNQHVAIIRADREQLHPTYLRYYLVNPTVKDNLLSMAFAGATRKALTKSMIENLEVTIPDYSTQQRIASILSSLDDKIELNRQMNQTLEEMAQAMFKHYFVDGIDEENLPDGWRLKTIGELLIHSKAGVNPANYADTLYHHYSLPAFDEKRYPSAEYGSQIMSNKSSVARKSILFSKLNPRFPRIWPVISPLANAVASTEFLVFEPHKPYYTFVYCLLSSKEFMEELAPKATGTSGSHQRVRPSDILDEEIAINEELCLRFEEQAYPFVQLMCENLEEVQTLTETRDYLLPKLISGEVIPDDLKEIEQIL